MYVGAGSSFTKELTRNLELLGYHQPGAVPIEIVICVTCVWDHDMTVVDAVRRHKNLTLRCREREDEPEQPGAPSRTSAQSLQRTKNMRLLTGHD